MKKIILPLAILWYSAQMFAQNFSNGFNFNMSYNDSTKQTFLPYYPIEEIKDGEFISKDSEGNFTKNGEPIKFWGTNLITAGAFINKDYMPGIAGRMRKMGFNLVRFHHIDNAWSEYSLFYNNPSVSTTEYNDTKFDLLQNTIAELKKQGIYIDMNLHVSRFFTKGDGIPEADSIQSMGTEFYKGVTLFDPYLIKLQKQYAKELLTRVNTYTGLPLVNDPVMAMVEIANENSLFRNWKNEELSHFSEGGKLCWRHKVLLDSLWIEYLTDTYKTTDSLRKSWNEKAYTVDKELIVNGDFENPNITEGWVFEAHNGASATLTADNDAFDGNASAKVTVTNCGTETWHLQLEQLGFPLNPDSTYLVTFYAKADSDKDLVLNIMRHGSPYTSYSWNQIQLTTEWKQYMFSFKPSELNTDDTRLAFSFNLQTGTFWFDNISMKYPSISGLKEYESLEKKNVARITFTERLTHSSNRLIDLMKFYEKLQVDYFAEMKSYLKDTLGVKVPISGTNWYVGPEDLKVQSTLDYIDNHAYWNHPDFYKDPWDTYYWRIDNKSMLTHTGHNTIRNLFMGFSVKNMPFTISEYNHAFPNQYQSEMLPIITAYASFHKADAIMFFPYGSSDWERDFNDGFFDIHRNSIVMSGSPLFAYAYRNRLISEAQESVAIQYDEESVYNSSIFSSSSWAPVFKYDNNLCYQNDIEIVDFNAETATSDNDIPQVGTNEFTTTTNEITWNIENGILEVDAPQFKSISGYLQHSPTLQSNAMGVENSTDFGSVAWLSLTDEPVETSPISVLNISSKVINSGMVWDEDNQTVHKQWGSSPTQYNPVTMNLKLKTDAKVIKVVRMDTKGYADTSKYRAYWPNENGIATISIDQSRDKTLWYAIENLDDDTGIVESTDGITSLSGVSYYLSSTYSPRDTYLHIHNPKQKNISVEIIDVLGNVIKQHSTSKIKDQIDISQKKAGVFFIKIVSEEQIIGVEKIVIE